jgi:hypothetical protein
LDDSDQRLNNDVDKAQQPSFADNPSGIKKPNKRKLTVDSSDHDAAVAKKRLLRRAEYAAFVLPEEAGKFGCSRCFKLFSSWHNAVGHYRDIHLKRRVFPAPWHCTFPRKSNGLKCNAMSKDEKTKEHHLRLYHLKRECRFCKSIFDLTPVNGGMSESERHETEIHGKPPVRRPRKKKMLDVQQFNV